MMGTQLAQPNQIKTIFGVIEIIYSTNQVLLKDLEEVANNWNEQSKVADCFLQIVPYLKVIFRH
jgi:hypothetical protein